MSVVVSRGGKNAQRLERSAFETEEYLQRYLQANPECIPLHELKDGIQTVVLAREFPTGSGNIDAFAVDQDGDVYLIETKLYRNSDKRRVIAQVLDYGAALATTYVDKPEFFDALDRRAAAAFDCTAIGKIGEAFGRDEVSATAFRDGIYERIVSGRLTFVVLMDQMDERLKDLIKFINRNSLFDILGVELDFYRTDDIEILIPRLFGGEVRKEAAAVLGANSTRSRRQWTEDTFLETARQRLNPEQFAAVERLLGWSRQHAPEIAWGAGKERGTFSVRFPEVSPAKSVFSVYTDGTLSLNVGWLTESETALACARSLVACVRGLGLAEVPANFEQKYPSVRIDEWKEKVDAFTRCVEQSVEVARRAASDISPA